MMKKITILGIYGLVPCYVTTRDHASVEAFFMARFSSRERVVAASTTDGRLLFQPLLHRRENSNIASSTIPLYAKSKKTKKKNKAAAVVEEIPETEFSRQIQPDRVLKIKRDYKVTITASDEECAGLAKRFDVSKISALSSELILRPEVTGNRGIEVDGICKSTVTQRCVRTNEDFVVDLEFPVFAIVRPVTPAVSSNDSAGFGEESDADTSRYKSDQQPRTKIKSMPTKDRNLNEMDVLELQRLLQTDLNDDDVIEDEVIYSTGSTLDIGELVSQLFWFKLDPYPKKPGTNPVRISITG